jgi:hypothetical protein
MVDIVGTRLVLGDGELVIEPDDGGYVIRTTNRVTIKAPDVITVAGLRARVDGGGRVEIHADDVTRIDAGGTGITFTPTRWDTFIPEWYGDGWRRSPPEHPDTGGSKYWVPWDVNHELLGEYYALFPGQGPSHKPPLEAE